MAVQDLDASFLMWDIRRSVRRGRLPERVVIHFEFPDAKREMQQWWLLVSPDDIDLCLQDPGYEVDVGITTDLRTMTQIWMGDLGLRQARAKE